ncbi:kinesin-like protein KIN-14I [Rutidosis leptorrhynchoides]|uniref:kinesin-like protein KIN-14I n=1 Tax=Rutidosis leptorrhynchoides TaxID=125765 RepID=UPI003A9A2C95
MAKNDDESKYTVASMIEDVLLEHGEQLCDVNTSKKTDAKIATKRYEATRWLRKMVGVVAAKDLPAEPSEQNFRMGLRSGIILCNVLNKIEPGAIPKVVGAPFDSVIIPDGAPLSSCPYFENIRNFLLAIEERRLPTFEASDLEQGGKLSRVVNCILALISYSEWKKAGGFGTFKYKGNPKPSTKRKEMVCKALDMDKCDELWKGFDDKPLHARVRELLSDQKPEDIPVAVDIVLSKLTEELERRWTAHNEKTGKNESQVKRSFPRVRMDSIKQAPKDTNSETGFKAREIFMKAEQLKNKEKEENANLENKKREEKKSSFSSIISEMRKKTNEDAKKPSADITNETQKKTTTFTKTSVSDTNNEVQKSTKEDIKKSTTSATDTNNEVQKSANEDIKKSTISHVHTDIENDVNIETEEENEASDVNDEVEENEIIDDDDDDDNDDDNEDDDDDVNEDDMDINEETDDADNSTNDIDKEMEKKAMEIEKKKELQKKKEMEKRKEMEKQAAEDKKEEDIQALKNTFSTAKADMELLRTNYQEEVNNLGKHLGSLAEAAAGYRKVVDENRKLYNQVQDLKGSIRVYCRVRPFLPGTQGKKPSCVECPDDGTMIVTVPDKTGKEQKKSFTFNRVFNPSATQSLVYTDTQPLIRSVLDGYNICIFAYGQTGSGKTFTMTGPDDLTPETMGVNYRALNDLFDIQQQRKNMIAYEVRVQMLEIYNEMVRDLLSTDGSKKLEIRLGTADGINVPEAALVPVSTTEDVIRLMNMGHNNRAVGSTAMNSRSSRSHSCLTVHVSGKDLTTGSTVRASMHLVDLAGSERADNTGATGDRLKEATHINKSLSALGDVIASLAQKNGHVPYRNSKLTLLLQDALGGQAKTLMFIHVSPDPTTVGETISTLKFAERVSTVELGAAKSTKDDTDLRQLKEQVAFLKAALAKEGGDGQHACDGGDDEDDDASECSEADSQPQKSANGPASKLKKPTSAPGKSPQSRASPAAAASKKPAAASSATTKTATGKTPAKKVGK